MLTTTCEAKGTVMYDKETIQRLGTSVENPYFMQDCVKEELESDYQARFVCDDDSRIVFSMSDAALDEIYYTHHGDWEKADLAGSCTIDVYLPDGTHSRYMPDENGSALDAYLDDHPDVKALDSGTYSTVTFNEKLARENLDTKLRCQGIIRSVQPGDPFDARKYCEIVDAERSMYQKASDLGINAHECPIAHTTLDIDRWRLQAGLFKENMEIDVFSDTYKDVYGVRPRHMVGREVEYLSQAEEQARCDAVDRYRRESSMQDPSVDLSPIAGASTTPQQESMQYGN